jgi:uncharacterized protein YajQ (UPF0234 family)
MLTDFREPGHYRFRGRIIGRIVTIREGKMPSVDVVSKVDLQALDNAINNAKREISTRFDFKKVKSEITFDRKAKYVHIVTGDDWKAKAVTEMLIDKCAWLKLDPRCLDVKEIEPTSHGLVKRDIFLKEGIPKETGQKIVKLIKGLKLKVQPTLQGNIPLQFVNMKS